MKYTIEIIQVIFALVLLSAASCSKTVTSQKIATPNLDVSPSSISEESYQSLKAKWTVSLNPGQPNASFPMAFGGSFDNKGRGRGGGFPLMVKATLMEAEVIEAGFKHYEKLLSMTPDEIDQFRQRYVELHDLEKNFLIEATLQTSWAEVYLDLTRWTIFLEDDQGNQYEPVKITEQSIHSSDPDDKFAEPLLDERSPLSFEMHQKQIFLYFPRKDYYGQSIIHEGINYLKIVFLQEEGGTARAEGIWTFKNEFESSLNSGKDYAH